MHERPSRAVSGQEDDRDVLRGCMRAKVLGQGEPTHPRHRHVGDDDVRVWDLPSAPHGKQSRAGQGDVVLGEPEEPSRRVRAGLVILAEQNTCADRFLVHVGRPKYATALAVIQL